MRSARIECASFRQPAFTGHFSHLPSLVAETSHILSQPYDGMYIMMRRMDQPTDFHVVFTKSHSSDRHCRCTNIRKGIHGRGTASSSECVFAMYSSASLTFHIIDAKHRPEAAMGGDVSGLRTATSGSLTDRLTREHRMTLDEARLILNLKKEETADQMLQVWSMHLPADTCTHYRPAL